MYRVEDKYILSDADMYILEHRISTILAPDYYSAKGAYTISSMYFDDIYDTHLNDTVDGVDIRDKYRIRIYNNRLDTIKLEVKHKQYNRILKLSCSITADEMKQLADGNTIIGSHPAISMFNDAILERALRPKVVVNYERSAYVCDAGNVRITFDRNVRASKDVSRFANSGLFFDQITTSGESHSVLEVKYDELLPEYIANTLEIGQLFQTSYSKYGLCREVYKCQ